MGRGRTGCKTTARAHSKGGEQPFFWDRGNRTSCEPSLQTTRKMKVPEKEINLMLFKPIWLQTIPLFSNQYVQLIAERSTCTYNCRNVRDHKVLSRYNNRRILLQITFSLPNLCSLFYLLTEITPQIVNLWLSDGLIRVLHSGSNKGF